MEDFYQVLFSVPGEKGIFGPHVHVVMDNVDRKTRSRMMSGIRSRDTKPEVVLRSLLHRRGYRFRIHVRDLPGTPDIVMPKWNVVIQVHGCFWHRHQGCKKASTPSSNQEFWQAKFNRNIQRDKEVVACLHSLGWRTLVVWECSLDRSRQVDPVPAIDTFIQHSRSHYGEVG